MTQITPERMMSSPEWLMQPDYDGVVVLDPDGWDRKNFAASWSERITEAEFNRRMVASTCQIPRSLIETAAAASTPPRTDAAGVGDDGRVALVMRAMYAAAAPHFEDVGQPLSQMRFLDKHRDMNLESMARAAIIALASRTAPSGDGSRDPLGPGGWAYYKARLETAQREIKHLRERLALLAPPAPSKTEGE